MTDEIKTTPRTCAHIVSGGICVFGTRKWAPAITPPARCVGCPGAGNPAPDEIKGLVTRLEQCLDGWCSIASWSDGTTGFAPPAVGPGSYQWIEQVTEEAAAALTLSDEARVRAEEEAKRAVDAEERLGQYLIRAVKAEALVRELVEGLRGIEADEYGDTHRELAQALILRAGNLGSSRAERAALLAPQANCSAAQSLDGGEG